MGREKRALPARVTLKIPRELYDNVQRMIQGTGFRSVNDFTVHVLRDVIAGGKLEADASGLAPHEVELIRQRLRSLGYLE